jgi:hypothetical protein
MKVRMEIELEGDFARVVNIVSDVLQPDDCEEMRRILNKARDALIELRVRVVDVGCFSIIGGSGP